jgi:hypothetical protein
MPADWKPDKPFQVFFEENRHFCQIKRKTRYQGRVFHNQGQSLERTARNNGRELHDVEGIFEVQRQLLLKLAKQENRAMETQENGTQENGTPLFNSLKRDTVQAIQNTWSPRSRPTTHQRALFLRKSIAGLIVAIYKSD